MKRGDSGRGRDASGEALRRDDPRGQRPPPPDGYRTVNADYPRGDAFQAYPGPGAFRGQDGPPPAEHTMADGRRFRGVRPPPRPQPGARPAAAFRSRNGVPQGDPGYFQDGPPSRGRPGPPAGNGFRGQPGAYQNGFGQEHNGFEFDGERVPPGGRQFLPNGRRIPPRGDRPFRSPGQPPGPFWAPFANSGPRAGQGNPGSPMPPGRAAGPLPNAGYRNGRINPNEAPPRPGPGPAGRAPDGPWPGRPGPGPGGPWLGDDRRPGPPRADGYRPIGYPRPPLRARPRPQVQPRRQAPLPQPPPVPAGQLIKQRDNALPERNQGSPAQPIAAIAPDGLESFARDLRVLRAKAELDYPEMAERSHYTMKTLASAAGGLRLPTLPVTVAYVQACGGDVADWEERWHKLAEKVGVRETASVDKPAEPAQPLVPQTDTGQDDEVYVITSARPRQPGQ